MCDFLHSLAKRILTCNLTLQVPETKIVEFANSVDLDEVAQNEPPHLDLQCLPSSLNKYDIAWA